MTVTFLYEPGTDAWVMMNGKPTRFWIQEGHATIFKKSAYNDNPQPSIRYEITQGGESYSVPECNICDSKSELIDRLKTDGPYEIINK
jgi:hypothetical protein